MSVNSFNAALCALAVFVVCVHTFALPYEGLYRLDIVHFNDFHARFEETSMSTPTCRFNNNSCLGGFPRLYTTIKQLLHEKPDALLLNAGDSFQGTYWYTLRKWHIIMEFMNLLPHDAHAIGNHEFDDGPPGLIPYLASLKAPVLIANWDVSDEPGLKTLTKPSIVINKNKRLIGIIGVTTVDTAVLSSPGKVRFTDPGVAARREAKSLKDRGVDIIVLLSHCGLKVDKYMAENYGEDIDLIIGGHTHSLMYNGPAPSGETVEAPYPAFVESSAKDGHQVLIVQASAFTKYVGNLSVYFDYIGDYVKWEGVPVFLNRSIPEDPEMKEMLAPYANKVHEAENIPIGQSDTELNYEDCVYGECTLGNLLVDSLNVYTKRYVKSPYSYISLIQRGNIKSSILKGVITEGEVFELLPYNDRIKTFELPGVNLLEALERSVSEEWAKKPFKGPWVLQVSGLQVTYNVSLPEGRRITSVLVDGDKPFTPEDYYQVTAPAYLADGGDGYTMLAKDKRKEVSTGRDQHLLEQYIKKNSPLNVEIDGRIVINY